MQVQPCHSPKQTHSVAATESSPITSPLPPCTLCSINMVQPAVPCNAVPSCYILVTRGTSSMSAVAATVHPENLSKMTDHFLPWIYVLSALDLCSLHPRPLSKSQICTECRPQARYGTEHRGLNRDLLPILLKFTVRAGSSSKVVALKHFPCMVLRELWEDQ